MTTKTQTRAPARALIGAAMFSSALAIVAVAAQRSPETGAPERALAETDRPTAQALTAQGPKTETADNAASASEVPAKRAKLIRASILPEIPAPLLTPAPGVSLKTPRVDANARDVECLQRAVYFESRGDTDVGQAAVAQVIINRARHPAFPKTVCAVINQGVERGSCQFSFVCKPTKVVDQREWRRAREVAERALDGHTVEGVGTSTFFHAARVNPGWKLTRVGQFGAHVFYRYPGARGAPAAFSRSPKPSLLDQIAAPIQAALNKPAVQTVSTPPAPILGFQAKDSAKPTAVLVSAPLTAEPMAEAPATVMHAPTVAKPVPALAKPVPVAAKPAAVVAPATLQPIATPALAPVAIPAKAS